MTELEPLEIASGMALEPIRLPWSRRARRPAAQPPGAGRAALEQIALDAMQRGRLSLSFSGGRDSSLLLAIATRVARREGFPDPLPITMRHPSPESHESEHQQEVLHHLGIHDWLKVDVGDTMDVLGDAGTASLRRHGLLSPANAYLHLSMVEVAPEGTMLTGGGGDEVLGTEPWRIAAVLYGRRRARLGDVARLGFAMSPMSVRRRIMARRETFTRPWLRPEAEREVRRRLAADVVRARMRWDAAALSFSRSRTETTSRDSLRRLGRPRVTITSPLAAESFVSAFAGEVGGAGPGTREQAMRTLGEDLLPERIVTRRTKASFGGLIWGPRFREFVEDWDPATLDPALGRLIDPIALRDAWRAEHPVYQSILPLQKAWLDQRAASAS